MLTNCSKLWEQDVQLLTFLIDQMYLHNDINKHVTQKQVPVMLRSMIDIQIQKSFPHSICLPLQGLTGK